MDCIFLNRCYQQWLRIKNCLSKHKYFVNIKSDLFTIFLVKQHNTQKWPKNGYIFLILEPIGRFIHCKKCSPPNMANKMSLNSYLDHHLCLIFQIWLHNNASWQKGHLIVHLAIWWVIAQTSQISQNSESKWPKWPWRSRSMTSIFNTSREYPRMQVWCKFGDSSPNLWRVIEQTSRIS